MIAVSLSVTVKPHFSSSASPYPDTICIVGHTPTVFLTGWTDEY